MSEEKEFPGGLMIKPLDKLGWVVSGFGIKKPHDNTPDFVKVNISILVENLRAWFISFEKDGIANEWATLTINEPYFQGRIDIKVAEFKEWVISLSKETQTRIGLISILTSPVRAGYMLWLITARKKIRGLSLLARNPPLQPKRMMVFLLVGNINRHCLTPTVALLPRSPCWGFF